MLQAPNTEGWVDPNSKNKKPKKNIDFSLHSLWGKDAAPVIEPEIFTASGEHCLTVVSMLIVDCSLTYWTCSEHAQNIALKTLHSNRSAIYSKQHA